jgi:hypothetical protein
MNAKRTAFLTVSFQRTRRRDYIPLAEVHDDLQHQVPNDSKNAPCIDVFSFNTFNSGLSSNFKIT